MALSGWHPGLVPGAAACRGSVTRCARSDACQRLRTHASASEAMQLASSPLHVALSPYIALEQPPLRQPSWHNELEQASQKGSHNREQIQGGLDPASADTKGKEQSRVSRQHAAGMVVPVYDLRAAWRTPRRDHSRITMAIGETNDFSALLELVAAQRETFNAINLTAAFNRAALFFRRPGLRPLDSRIASSQLLPLLVDSLRSKLGLLQPRAIASILHALAALDVRDRELFAELSRLAEPHMSEFTTQGLCNMLWSFARSGIAPSPRWMDLFVGTSHSKLSFFTAQELAMVMWALVKLKFRLNTDRHEDFTRRSKQLLPSCSPQAFSMSAYALGSLEIHPGQEWLDIFMRCLLPDAQQTEQAGSTGAPQAGGRDPGTRGQQASSRTFSAGGQGGQQDSFHAHAPSEQAQDYAPDKWSGCTHQLARLNPQGLTLTLWSLARMGYRASPAVGDVICRQLSISQLRGYQALDVSTLMYAIAKLEIELPSVLRGVVLYKFRDCVFMLEPNHLANAGWALATMQARKQWPVTAQKLLSQVLLKWLSAIYYKLGIHNSRDLSMTVWALAKLRCTVPESFLITLMERVEQVAAEFSPQDISLTIWGLAKLGATPSSSLMVEFFLGTDRRLSAFKPQELSQMVWALAKSGSRPEKAWIDEFLHATFPRLPEFTPAGLANITYAFGEMHIKPPPAWLYALVKAARAALPQCTRQDMWGLTVGMQAINCGPEGLQLQKLDEFLAEAQDATSLLPPAPPPLLARAFVPADTRQDLAAPSSSGTAISLNIHDSSTRSKNSATRNSNNSSNSSNSSNATQTAVSTRTTNYSETPHAESFPVDGVSASPNNVNPTTTTRNSSTPSRSSRLRSVTNSAGSDARVGATPPAASQHLAIASSDPAHEMWPASQSPVPQVGALSPDPEQASWSQSGSDHSPRRQWWGQDMEGPPVDGSTPKQRQQWRERQRRREREEQPPQGLVQGGFQQPRQAAEGESQQQGQGRANASSEKQQGQGQPHQAGASSQQGPGQQQPTDSRRPNPQQPRQRVQRPRQPARSSLLQLRQVRETAQQQGWQEPGQGGHSTKSPNTVPPASSLLPTSFQPASNQLASQSSHPGLQPIAPRHPEPVPIPDSHGQQSVGQSGSAEEGEQPAGEGAAGQAGLIASRRQSSSQGSRAATALQVSRAAGWNANSAHPHTSEHGRGAVGSAQSANARRHAAAAVLMARAGGTGASATSLRPSGSSASPLVPSPSSAAATGLEQPVHQEPMGNIPHAPHKSPMQPMQPNVSSSQTGFAPTAAGPATTLISKGRVGLT